MLLLLQAGQDAAQQRLLAERRYRLAELKDLGHQPLHVDVLGLQRIQRRKVAGAVGQPGRTFAPGLRIGEVEVCGQSPQRAYRLRKKAAGT